MAKGAIFWNNATGKIGNLVLSVRKGQQITRQYQPNVANPRTFAQTEQRIKFSNAGKFFRRAISNFFIGAFEGNEKLSPWNAFMKYNATNATLVTRDSYKDLNYPAIGRFVMSSGSLGALSVTVDDEAVGDGAVNLLCPNLASTDNTIGKVSAKILAYYPQLLNGDVITYLAISSRVTVPTATTYKAPVWQMQQFTLDTSNTSNLPSGFSIAMDGENDFNLCMKINEFDTSWSVGGCVIVARKTDTGIKATNSSLVLNSGAQSYMTSASTGAYPTQAALSWGAVASDAVLV